MESGTDVPLGIRDLKLPYSTKIADMLLLVYFREILGEIMSLFTPQGASNAMSIKDAMNTLVRYASILEEGQPSNSALVGRPSLDDGKRDELIARAIFSQDGKLALAQTMANPIN